mgnify:CR=1 FL=1
MTPYLIITDEMSHALCLAAKRGGGCEGSSHLVFRIKDDLQHHTIPFTMDW